MERHDFSTLIDSLANTNFAVVPGFLAPPLLESLRSDSNAKSAAGLFRAARVGQNVSEQPSIRNDVICWIDEQELTAAEGTLFQMFEALRQQLNRELFLGLKDFEAHYARYDAGHLYQRHLDRFQTDDARTISVVLYLNADWRAKDGGALRLHASVANSDRSSSLQASYKDVLPEGGTLVCFSSDVIEHEVLPSSTRERLSIAAWFRR